MSSTSHYRRSRLLRSVSLIAMLLGTANLAAQSTWDVTPYETRVWWVLGDQPDLPATYSARFASELQRKLQVVFRAAGHIEVRSAPAPIRLDVLRRFGSISREEVILADTSLLQRDKLFLVAIEGQHSGYRIRVREFDCQVAHFGPVDEDEANVLAQVSGRTAQLITRAFSPVVRIERSSGSVALTRLRAGSLLRGEQVPGNLEPGDLLLPFDRRVSTTGKTNLGDMRAIDWTYLQVPGAAKVPRSPGVTDAKRVSALGGRGNQLIELEIVSGFNQPFRAKRSRRHQQLAIRARPTTDQSVIRLQSRSKTPEPLVGYEIHEKGRDTTSFLGYTDYHGELIVPKSSQAVRILLVKSGDRVTAKLPIVPGLRDEVVASMLDDRQRMETDGFLSGIQTALVDLVARRESLTARIRRRIADGDLDEATKLIEAFRRLPTQADFRREIQQQQLALNVTDPQLRKRIATMFVETYRTLGQYLDTGRLRELEAELAAARPN